MIRSNGNYRLRIWAAIPDRLIGFHAPKEIANGLANRLDDVGPGSCSRRRFWSQVILTALQPGADGLNRHPSFGTRANCLFLPHVLLEALARQPPGKSPFIGIKLANSIAENCSAHRIKQITRQQALKSAALIKRSYKIQTFAIDRPQQVRYPGRR